MSTSPDIAPEPDGAAKAADQAGAYDGMSIWKYEIGRGFGNKLVNLPFGARPLSAGQQGELTVVWVLVGSDEKRSEAWAFFIVPTGSVHVSTVETFLGTVFPVPGIVAHVFARKISE